MAIRYSGDIEVRVRFLDGVYHGAVRAPGFRARGTLSKRDARVTHKDPTSSEAYDQAALAFIKGAMVRAKKAGKKIYPSGEGHIEVRRTFQSPCPYRE